MRTGARTTPQFAQGNDRFGIRRSMGRVGSSRNSAPTEGFWQGLKREAVRGLSTTVRQARLEIFQRLTYYNVRRRHNSLGYLSPVKFAQQHRTHAYTHPRRMHPRLHTPGDTSSQAVPALVEDGDIRRELDCRAAAPPVCTPFRSLRQSSSRCACHQEPALRARGDAIAQRPYQGRGRPRTGRLLRQGWTATASGRLGGRMAGGGARPRGRRVGCDVQGPDSWPPG
ncbi:integrase core domain-containing protein [Streptomyces sp. NPDC051014]|uniref:integrase core domain-containing protein n=1 Tax=Streptomyces sp. NPDC051014 TaxID=3155751 RepID=UPI0033E7C84E